MFIFMFAAFWQNKIEYIIISQSIIRKSYLISQLKMNHLAIELLMVAL